MYTSLESSFREHSSCIIIRWIITLFFFHLVIYGAGDRAIIIDNDGRTYSYNGTQDYITGTGVIATLEFLAGNAGEYDIKFLETTTLRRSNNDPIEIEEKVEGVVKID